MEPTIPKQLFSTITGHDEAAAIRYLEGLVSSHEKTFENQFLELKGGRASNISEIWSRQLSAFANTDGGVVIWGIGTQKEKGVDYAATLDKVAEPLCLQAILEKDLQHGTDPLVSGVVIRAIPSSGEPGFVVCHIPESAYKPHRAMLCKGLPYFGRFSHRTDTIPTAWLRQLFYPERSLRLSCRLDVVASDEIESKWQINGFIANQGPVTAQGMCVRLVSDRRCQFHALDDWILVGHGDQARTFERGEDGYDHWKEREWYAEFRCTEPLHPESETRPFQCDQVMGLVKAGMVLKVTVYSLDQAALSGRLAIEAGIKEQIEKEVEDGLTVTIHLKPPQELQPIR